MAEPRKPLETSKVMDITHPGRVQPSTTSRPVIVTNRPMIAEDPMINQAALSAIEAEKPAGAPKEQEVPETTTAPQVARQGKTITPVAPTAQEEPDSASQKTAASTEEKPAPVTITIDSASENSADEHQPQPVPSKEAVENVPMQTEKDGSDSPVPEEKPALDPAQPQTQEKTPFAVSSEGSLLDEGDQESKQKTVEDDRQEELEKIIAAGTYHVPIGQVAKRRGRLVVGIVFSVVLLLVLFDVVLDMGLFTIPGVPHTTFLR